VTEQNFSKETEVSEVLAHLDAETAKRAVLVGRVVSRTPFFLFGPLAGMLFMLFVSDSVLLSVAVWFILRSMFILKSSNATEELVLNAAALMQVFGYKDSDSLLWQVGGKSIKEREKSFYKAVEKAVEKAQEENCFEGHVFACKHRQSKETQVKPWWPSFARNMFGNLETG